MCLELRVEIEHTQLIPIAWLWVISFEGLCYQWKVNLLYCFTSGRKSNPNIQLCCFIASTHLLVSTTHGPTLKASFVAFHIMLDFKVVRLILLVCIMKEVSVDIGFTWSTNLSKCKWRPFYMIETGVELMSGMINQQKWGFIYYIDR